VTVERARALGLDAIAVPLFEIEPLSWEAPDPAGFNGLLLTSANAVRWAGNGTKFLRSLPVYAVGETTAAAAREVGFKVAATGNAGVERLLGSIQADLKLLHLCGADRREIANSAQAIVSMVVYRAKVIDAPSLGSVSGSVAIIHSPRAGRRFAELVEARHSISIAAISAAAAEAVGPGWKSVASAEQPNDEALLALAARLCNNSTPK
jgi:uroporphyrinogen-III synthase